MYGSSHSRAYGIFFDRVPGIGGKGSGLHRADFLQEKVMFLKRLQIRKNTVGFVKF
jgi:hypothetical protein